MLETLRLTEIFHSIQGESLTAGCPTVFVRLTGCPLRCSYCDTAYAFQGGQKHTLDETLEKVSSYACKHVCVTGGEPLAQKACLPFLSALADRNYTVSLETSGAMPIEKVDPRVMIVMDIKTPDSAESEKNLLENLRFLKKTDQIKFVLCSRADYEWACECIRTYKLSEGCTVLFSPSWEQLNPTELAEWILADQLPVRLQLQLHKILWPNEQGK